MINRTDILQELYEYITIPSYVYEEFLQAPYDIKKEVNRMIEKKFIKIKNVESMEEIKMFYKFKYNIYIKEVIGNGAASALALAKIFNGVLASNNTRDVALTVKAENIAWIKTGDILEYAIDSKLITFKEANKLWKEMLDKGRHLGKYKTLTDYLEYKSNRIITE